MLDLLRGQDTDHQVALEEKDAEIAMLQARLNAYQAADQRDFLADNSDQLATIISTKNQVIHDLQLQLKTTLTQNSDQPDPSQALAQALENAQTSAAEVERLRHQLQGCERKFRDQEHRLQLYREENHRQAGELAINAAKSAAEIGQLQAQLEDLTRKADEEGEAKMQKLEELEAKRTQFEEFCAERTKALEAKEAAAVEFEATLKQQQAQSQQAAEGMHALEDAEGKIAAKEG